jgi:MFS transporter, DHA1 family, multidrug resistance protein
LALSAYILTYLLSSAASAIAANTFLRSLCGAGFPLFASYMFNGMGIQWAATVLGCIATALIPIPVIFYMYGAKIRAKSAFAPTYGPPPSQPAADDVEVDEPSAREKEQQNPASLSNVPKTNGDKATDNV